MPTARSRPSWNGSASSAPNTSNGTCDSFGLYLANLTWPLIALGWVTSLFQRGAASMTRILEILDAVPAIRGPELPRLAASPPPTSGGRALTFEGVGFAYPARGDAAPHPVLREALLDARGRYRELLRRQQLEEEIGESTHRGIGASPQGALEA